MAIEQIDISKYKLSFVNELKKFTGSTNITEKLLDPEEDTEGNFHLMVQDLNNFDGENFLKLNVNFSESPLLIDSAFYNSTNETYNGNLSSEVAIGMINAIINKFNYLSNSDETNKYTSYNIDNYRIKSGNIYKSITDCLNEYNNELEKFKKLYNNELKKCKFTIYLYGTKISDVVTAVNSLNSKIRQSNGTQLATITSLNSYFSDKEVGDFFNRLKNTINYIESNKQSIDQAHDILLAKELIEDKNNFPFININIFTPSGLSAPCGDNIVFKETRNAKKTITKLNVKYQYFNNGVFSGGKELQLDRIKEAKEIQSLSENLESEYNKKIKKIDTGLAAKKKSIKKTANSLLGLSINNYCYALKDKGEVDKLPIYSNWNLPGTESDEQINNIIELLTSNTNLYKESDETLYKIKYNNFDDPDNVKTSETPEEVKNYGVEVLTVTKGIANVKVKLINLKTLLLGIAKEYNEATTNLKKLIDENSDLISIPTDDLEALDLSASIKVILKKLTFGAFGKSETKDEDGTESTDSDENSEEELASKDLVEELLEDFTNKLKTLSDKVNICCDAYLRENIDIKFNKLYTDEDYYNERNPKVILINNIEDDSTLEKNLGNLYCFNSKSNTNAQTKAKASNKYLCYKTANDKSKGIKANISLLKASQFMKDQDNDRDIGSGENKDGHGEIYQKYIDKSTKSNLYDTISKASSLSAIENYNKLTQ